MTALDAYARLESSGLWRPTPDAQRLDVGLSFGKATLVITDSAERPLTHWSLPAIQRLNPGLSPALYSPDPDAVETLEIEDQTMIDAIEQIQDSLGGHTRNEGRLRLGIGLVLFAALALLCLFWLPGALVRQTAAVVPDVKRTEIGARLLGHMQRVTGPTCRNALGTAALTALKDRIVGEDAPGQIVVMRAGLVAPTVLPGRIIALPYGLIDGTDDPNVVAGHTLAAVLTAEAIDPLERVLGDAGLSATFRLLTTGDLPDPALDSFAKTLATVPSPLATADVLEPGFAAAQIPVTPWAYDLDPSGETVPDLLAIEWEGADTAAALLTDGEWISLRGICQE